MSQGPARPHRGTRRRHGQQGFLLLEVLVAILIFAIGVLSLVGLQAASVRQSGEAKFRADATLLANDLIGRMWIGDRSFANLQASFQAGGAGYDEWLDSVQAALPGVVDGVAESLPAVTVESVPGGPAGADLTSLVTVVVRWRSPNEPATDPFHSITVVTQIR
jgi:type IV pilus assembly protein PilV